MKPNDGNPEPDTQCPEWCRLHIEGQHVAELELTGQIKGYNIYVRPTDGGGLEVVVVSSDGKKLVRVPVPAAAVQQAAVQAALLEAMTAHSDSGGPDDDGPPS